MFRNITLTNHLLIFVLKSLQKRTQGANPRTTPSVRKGSEGEREKEERGEKKQNQEWPLRSACAHLRVTHALH